MAQIVGGCMFATFFVAVAMGVSGSREIAGAIPTVIGVTLAGFALLIFGGFLRRVGRSGLAGSGVTLDPEQARRDVEPWARAAGGVLSDTLDEAGIDLKPSTPTATSGLPFDEQLRRLEALKRDGLVTEEEYQATRSKILDGIAS